MVLEAVEKERIAKMNKAFGILSLFILTLFFLVVSVNVLYWGFIFTVAKVGKLAIVFIGVTLLFLITSYVTIFKSLLKKSFLVKLNNK